MKKVIDYLAIKAISTAQLTEYVNMQIKNGYEPIGGISCSSLSADETGKPTNNAVFCQALVKYSTE